jgi:hypothetical protein
VPRVLTADEWNQLLTERDPFTLAIRGQSAIEAMIDAAIAEAAERLRDGDGEREHAERYVGAVRDE